MTTARALTEAEDDCPHCSPTHGSPHRCAWGVYIDDLVDGDGQPVRLIVQPTDGAHVAPADVRWLWQLIRNQPPEPPAPLPTRAEVLAKADAALADAVVLSNPVLARPIVSAIAIALHERGWLAWREET